METIRTHLRAIYRVGIFVTYLSAYLIRAYWIHLFEKDPDERLRKYGQNTVRWARLGIPHFNITVNVINRPQDDEIFLYVGNHMGFIDILCISTIMPFSFVTSLEMKSAPGLGLVTEMAGCLYVDRRNRGRIQEEMNEMAKTMQRGFRVVLFPEATSHNGEEVLPFKRTLIMSAAQAKVAIRPVVFNFIEVDGQPFSLANRDKVCWYGDMAFFPSLYRSFTCSSIVAQVEFLPAYVATENEERSKIADSLHDQIAARFQPAR